MIFLFVNSNRIFIISVKGDDYYEYYRYKFHEGDFVENRDGRVGYISHLCHCEKCKERGFYEPIIKYTDGSEDYISNYSVKNVRCEFKRIGLQNFDEIKNNSLKKVIGTLEELRENDSDQEIIISTSLETIRSKIGDILFYEGTNGELVIDSE